MYEAFGDKKLILQQITFLLHSGMHGNRRLSLKIPIAYSPAEICNANKVTLRCWLINVAVYNKRSGGMGVILIWWP